MQLQAVSWQAKMDGTFAIRKRHVFADGEYEHLREMALEQQTSCWYCNKAIKKRRAQKLDIYLHWNADDGDTLTEYWCESCYESGNLYECAEWCEWCERLLEVDIYCQNWERNPQYKEGYADVCTRCSHEYLLQYGHRRWHFDAYIINDHIPDSSLIGAGWELTDYVYSQSREQQQAKYKLMELRSNGYYVFVQGDKYAIDLIFWTKPQDA